MIERRRTALKAWPFFGIFLIQIILLLAHWFLFHTFIAFWPGLALGAASWLRVVVLALAFTFAASSLLSFRFSNFAVRLFYKIASVWLGLLNYLFLGACLCWLTWYAMSAFGKASQNARPMIAVCLFALAVLTCVYGMLNARWIRVRHIGVSLDNLPDSWRGRKALLMSDLHLGNINGAGFSRRLVALADRLRPDIVFLPGDLFDGTKADLDRLVAPFKGLTAPLGSYFSTGNHEEFTDPVHYIEAVTRAGIRVLNSESVTVEGVRIIGIRYGDSTYPIRTRATLEALNPGSTQASILLCHAPIRLPIVEQAGISLQLSGHTHGGQLFPYTYFTRRIFGRFTHGLHNFGALQVYTSTGAGTWGPPMRVGTQPEVVVLEFANARQDKQQNRNLEFGQ
jgi:predicted MPP superfamily phosphohydrolase